MIGDDVRDVGEMRRNERGKVGQIMGNEGRGSNERRGSRGNDKGEVGEVMRNERM